MAKLRATPEFAAAEIVNLDLRSETESGLSGPNHAGGRYPVPASISGSTASSTPQETGSSPAAANARNPQFIYAKDNVYLGEEGHHLIADLITRPLWPLLKLPGSPRLPVENPRPFPPENLLRLNQRAVMMHL